MDMFPVMKGGPPCLVWLHIEILVVVRRVLHIMRTG